MNLDIYGWNILKKHFPTISFSKSKLKNILKEEFSSFKVSNIDIVFTTKKHIQELNREFRKKDTPTDVLSFEINKEPLKGEIYVCPEYIGKENGEKEVIRIVVHGFLHIVGYQHKGYFDEGLEEKEDMFVKQEEMLENIYNNLNN
jgi:probable rRNA maturation factor